MTIKTSNPTTRHANEATLARAGFEGRRVDRDTSGMEAIRALRAAQAAARRATPIGWEVPRAQKKKAQQVTAGPLGAGKETRTLDFNLGKVALYH